MSCLSSDERLFLFQGVWVLESELRSFPIKYLVSLLFIANTILILLIKYETLTFNEYLQFIPKQAELLAKSRQRIHPSQKKSPFYKYLSIK